ncbi:MAG: NADP-dependent oxidoreductase [Thermoflavifilum sp.]|nr:NADP-dependent oxidoreductase [Thermoflavifilum sp.]MCL6514288.1 NADP-dependent oxidoreductase [Alicyclobacillus sp.]
MTVNRRILLVRRPHGMPMADDFAIVEGPVPEPAEGEMLIRTLYLSVDPYMRGRMNDARSYVPPFALNEVVEGGVIGQVVASRHTAYRAGDIVVGTLGWADYNLSDGRGLRRLDPSAAPITAALGVLGMPGLTAYVGTLDIGRVQTGETFVVSAAAGAVGSVAGQIAKIHGCRVVGIAGSDEKCRWVTEELGFDAAVNYRAAGSLVAALREACPNGVDVYFDNVGGDVTDAVLPLLNDFARIALCGQIALYNLEKPDMGPRNWSYLLIHRATLQGFIVRDHAHRAGQAYADLARWIQEGRIRWREHIVEGLENTIDAFLGLFRGDNIGKQLVKVADPA